MRLIHPGRMSILKVFSVNGAEIFNSNLVRGSNQINIQCAPGIYLLILQSTEETKYHKVYLD